MATKSIRQGVSDIELRPAEIDDAQAITLLLAAAFEEFRHLYTPAGFAATAIAPAEVASRMKQGPVWVAVIQSVIIGTISAVRKYDSVYVRGMAVHPNCRGRGAGERLLDRVTVYAVDEGFDRLFLSTTPFLYGAISLYEKYGFRRTDEGPHDLFGTPLFTMEKLLSPHQ